MEPIASFHASPIDMAPSWRGETRTAAVEDRIRYLPSSLGGSGADENAIAAYYRSRVGISKADKIELLVKFGVDR